MQVYLNNIYLALMISLIVFFLLLYFLHPLGYTRSNTTLGVHARHKEPYPFFIIFYLFFRN